MLSKTFWSKACTFCLRMNILLRTFHMQTPSGIVYNSLQLKIYFKIYLKLISMCYYMTLWVFDNVQNSHNKDEGGVSGLLTRIILKYVETWESASKTTLSFAAQFTNCIRLFLSLFLSSLNLFLSHSLSCIHKNPFVWRWDERDKSHHWKIQHSMCVREREREKVRQRERERERKEGMTPRDGQTENWQILKHSHLYSVAV